MVVVNSVAVEFLVKRILNEEVEILSESQLQLIEQHRELVSEFLLPIVDRQMELVSGDLKKVNGKALYWGLALLTFLKSSDAFEFLRELCHVEVDVIDACLGNAFVTECLSWMLAGTVSSNWTALKEEIEDPDLEEFVRGACLDALSILLIRGEISREEIVAYFKGCFHKILYEDIDDEPLATQLVGVCMEIWPGECLEEIKELYGIGLLDNSFAEIDTLLDSFLAGKESCIKELARRVSEYHPLYPLVGGSSFLTEKIKPDDLEILAKEADNAYLAAEAILLEEKEGKKSLFDTLLSEGTLHFDPNIRSDLHDLPPEEQEKVHKLHEKIFSSPKEALQEAIDRVNCFPENPVVYSHLYIVYCELNWKREAILLIKAMINKFPFHLFALSEYAKYFLRRGEPEAVMELFQASTSLKELYPERDNFNQYEWQTFAHIMALYHTQVENYQEAKSYLEILEMIDPHSDEVQEVEEKLRMSAFSKAFRAMR